MELPKKTYFASDFHLGIDAALTSREREKKIVRWLQWAGRDAEAIYLVGDLFDFWFEYQKVIPKGHTRLIGQLASLRDAGLPIYIFTGNHDMWMFRYFEDELDIPIYRQPIVREIHGKTFFIGHGDGLGPGDHGYKMIKRIFVNRLCQWMFARLHPNFGIWLANYWSGRSRDLNREARYFLGKDKEWLYIFSEKESRSLPADYFIFGHRHLPIDCLLPNGRSRYINLGEWMSACSYAVFDGDSLRLEFFENPDGKIVTG